MYNGENKKASHLSFIVCWVSCVCVHIPHTPCVCFNMVFNMVSERAIVGPAPNWVSHLCLWPMHICIFAAFRDFLQQCFCRHSKVFWRGATFNDFAAFRNWFWRRAALHIWRLISSYNFCLLNSAPFWRVAEILFKLGFWRILWVFFVEILCIFWKEKFYCCPQFCILSILLCF